MNATVLGAGSWGTALAILLARNDREVTLVGRAGDEIEALRSRRENLRYLPGFVVPSNVNFRTFDDVPALGDMLVVAVPSGAVRQVVSSLKWPEDPSTQPVVVVAAKGLEAASGMTMTDVVKQAAPGSIAGILSGPNLAIEVVRGVPAASVIAFAEADKAEVARTAFMCPTFRIYLSADVVGVQLAGALKNVLAIGAGVSDGLGFGDNTKAALLARGLHEMTALGLAMGARLDTFMGIAGVGDLFATAASSLSRNYRLGKALGQRQPLSDALAAIDQVAEGVPTSEAAAHLSREHNVSMPVFEAIEGVLKQRLDPLDAVARLMERMPKHEGF